MATKTIGQPRRSESWSIALISWLLALAVIVTWSGAPSIMALVATSQLEPIHRNPALDGDDQAILGLRRQIQKHYLNYGVYLPLEDIMLRDQVLKLNASLDNALHRYCSDAVLGIWVPLKFRLPIIGERVVEWCWKPVLHK